MHFGYAMHCDGGENDDRNDYDDDDDDAGWLAAPPAYFLLSFARCAYSILPEVFNGNLRTHTHLTQRNTSQMFSRDRFLTASNSIKN